MLWVELCPFTSCVFLRLVDVTFEKVFISVIILDSGGLKVPGETGRKHRRRWTHWGRGSDCSGNHKPRHEGCGHPSMWKGIGKDPFLGAKSSDSYFYPPEVHCNTYLTYGQRRVSTWLFCCCCFLIGLFGEFRTFFLLFKNLTLRWKSWRNKELSEKKLFSDRKLLWKTYVCGG